MKASFRLLLLTAFTLALIGSCKNKPVTRNENPFFNEYDTPFGVPPFDQIKVRHFMPAFEKGMNDGKEELQKIIGNTSKPNYKNTVAALDNLGSLLTRVTYVFQGLASANTNDSIQSVEMEISPRISQFRDEIMLNPDLFSRIKSVYDNQSTMKLTSEQKFILENLYRNMVRNGALLSSSDQDTLKKLNGELSLLAVKFGQNVLEETNRFKLIIDRKNDLNGLPSGVVEGAAATAREAGAEGKWIFTTQKPSMLPFLTYSENRDLRRKLYDAYLTRGNHNDSLDNKKNLAAIIRLRAKRAKLLGYKSHADLQLENRMAQNPGNVFKLLDQLWTPALKVAGEELSQMQQIADKEGAKFKIEPSDWWYYAEKLRMQKYNLDDNELRPYFKLENVREGAFTVAGKLYGITFTPITNIPLPHPDAAAFEVKEADGKHLAVLYMDFYTRDSKGQGAWCGTYRDHRWIGKKEIAPVVTMVCNFNNPSQTTPSLLSLDDVNTLFHEFGHALQSIFAANTYASTYPAMDIIELPSQIMEHWAVEPEVLKMYAKNFSSGETMPDTLIKKIQNSKYFNTGFDNTEILAATMLDMAYHTQQDPAIVDVEKFENDYLDKIGLIREIEPRYKSTYFSHIVGGYDAGYYVYTWAAVLDNDAFEAFREKGIFDSATAGSFRRDVLAPMGITDAKQSYVKFRGKDASIDALLTNRGLK